MKGLSLPTAIAPLFEEFCDLYGHELEVMGTDRRTSEFSVPAVKFADVVTGFKEYLAKVVDDSIIDEEDE